MLRPLAVFVISIVLAGCSLFKPVSQEKLAPVDNAKSTGEVHSGYTYVPIDPFSVQSVPRKGCSKTPNSDTFNLLDALPDNAVRMLVESFDASGNVTYGASKAGLQNQSYRVTVDYINADTLNVPVWLTKAMWNTSTNQSEFVDPTASVPPNYLRGSEIYDVRRYLPTSKDAAANFTPYNIPVYVGVGLRVSANVYVKSASANISGIGIIGAEAEANNLNGSLIVQTLGINGKSVAAALPIQSELNRTTAQNAITAVASIKTLLYSDETAKSPRVVGLYLPFPGGQALVNALISALSTDQVTWERSCSSTVTQIAATDPKGKPTLSSNSSPTKEKGSEKPEKSGDQANKTSEPAKKAQPPNLKAEQNVGPKSYE